MWDTLANTIADERLTLYLILDEAHRGMKRPSHVDRAEKATIVQRLVNGASDAPPVPIVWGISATVKRFEEAMAEARGRTTYPSVVVAPERVQESGLLKDDIRLDFPAEAGRFDTVLLARATKKAKEATELWRGYAQQEGGEVVVPLLVVQVPNKPSVDLLVDAFDALPSQTLPRRAARPLRRLSAFAQALSRDGLRSNARKDAYRNLFDKLDGLMAQHKAKVAAASKGILEVQGETLVARIVGGDVHAQEAFVEAADERSIEADFQAASHVLTADLARKYADHLAEGDEDDDGLFDAHVKVAALAQVEGIAGDLDREADRLSKEWFADYRVALKALSDERRAVYDEIKGMSPEVQETEIKRPRVRAEETETADGDKLESRIRHLMADADGNFPVGSLNSWEIGVLDREIARDGFQAWYRNPARPSADALSVAYRNAQDHWRRMCPDFIFFHGEDDDVKVSIVDPHGHHLADALPKLRGLANFAEAHSESFHRIESVARLADGVLRVLDLTDPNVREAVASYQDIQTLYRSDVASDY